MKKFALVIEIIASLIGIYLNMENQGIFGLSMSVWNTIVFITLIIGFALLFWDDNNLEKRISTKVEEKVREIQETMKPKEGTIESITPQDHEIIRKWSMEMILNHGHDDNKGLLADRASGIRLNELMFRNCSLCGDPRNKQSTNKSL
jgi:hypothetical protein